MRNNSLCCDTHKYTDDILKSEDESDFEPLRRIIYDRLKKMQKSRLKSYRRKKKIYQFFGAT